MTKKNEASESNEETMQLDPDDVTNPEDENEDEESNEDEMDSEESDSSEEEEDSDEQEDSDDEGEYEIVLDDGKDLSDKERKTQKYHDRMNEKNAEASKAREAEAKANVELDAKDRELEAYKQHFDQQTNDVKKGPPKAEDYPEESYDPAYIKDLGAYHENLAANTTAEMILKARAQDEQKRKIDAKKLEVDKCYESHYQRATDLDKKLKVKDYDAMEKVALGILSAEKADFIVECFDNSELIFYKFGKDPAKAHYFNNLLDKSAGRALKELGVFESKIKKVKRKINKSPDPEKRTRGGYIKSKKGERGPPGAKYK